jgi:hypothetical protein
MPHYIPTTKEESAEIISILEDIVDKQKRRATIADLVANFSQGSKKGRVVVSKMVKQNELSTYYYEKQEYFQRVYTKVKK